MNIRQPYTEEPFGILFSLKPRFLRFRTIRPDLACGQPHNRPDCHAQHCGNRKWTQRQKRGTWHGAVNAEQYPCTTNKRFGIPSLSLAVIWCGTVKKKKKKTLKWCHSDLGSTSADWASRELACFGFSDGGVTVNQRTRDQTEEKGRSE